MSKEREILLRFVWLSRLFSNNDKRALETEIIRDRIADAYFDIESQEKGKRVEKCRLGNWSSSPFF
jgi:hypothetical protein